MIVGGDHLRPRQLSDREFIARPIGTEDPDQVSRHTHEFRRRGLAAGDQCTKPAGGECWKAQWPTMGEIANFGRGTDKPKYFLIFSARLRRSEHAGLCRFATRNICGLGTGCVDSDRVLTTTTHLRLSRSQMSWSTFAWPEKSRRRCPAENVEHGSKLRSPAESIAGIRVVICLRSATIKTNPRHVEQNFKQRQIASEHQFVIGP